MWVWPRLGRCPSHPHRACVVLAAAVKIVHAADLHLDSPLAGLERHEGVPADQIRGATRRAFTGLVDLCVEQQAALLVIAGDLFDGDWRDYSSGLFFAAQMRRARAAGVRIAWLRGNHDAASHITRYLELPGIEELGVKRPQTVVYEELGVAVHGQGFAAREVTDDLAQHYPAPLAGLLNMGLLHTSVTGREGHQPYAPCGLETLVDRGYDYWALGHVHTREVLHERPWVVFPGNLQGRHARETGPKGATLIDVEGGRIASVEPVSLDVVRWAALDVDVSEAGSFDDAVELTRDAMEAALGAADGRLLVVRVVVSGAARVHSALRREPERFASQIRVEAGDLGRVFIEKVRVATRDRVDPARLRERSDAVGQLARSLVALRAEPSALVELAPELSELAKKLRPLGDALGVPLPDDPRVLADALDDVEALILPRLLALEDP